MGFDAARLGEEWDWTVIPPGFDITKALAWCMESVSRADVVVMLKGWRRSPGALNEKGFGLYEQIHGSAPDIKCQGKANPIATILSAAMMLRLSFSLPEAADAVEKAVDRVLLEGARTPDLASPGESIITTQEMGRRIAEAVASV